jgi:hypothetical protein
MLFAPITRNGRNTQTWCVNLQDPVTAVAANLPTNVDTAHHLRKRPDRKVYGALKEAQTWDTSPPSEPTHLEYPISRGRACHATPQGCLASFSTDIEKESVEEASTEWRNAAMSESLIVRDAPNYENEY